METEQQRAMAKSKCFSAAGAGQVKDLT